MLDLMSGTVDILML